MRRAPLRRLLLLLSFAGVTAQAQVAVVGVVEDPSGAAIASVRVTLDHMSARTDAGGQFRFDSIALGPHRIQVNAGAAFDVLKTDIAVRPGMAPLVLKLRLAAVQEQVEVTESDIRPTVDTSANLDTTKIT